ncbi:MAG: hypothetical protein JOZ41_13610 [Chloroflexi bacterium]|nr:hypothetical protein [Chloroflexota bacterium]
MYSPLVGFRSVAGRLIALSLALWLGLGSALGPAAARPLPQVGSLTRFVGMVGAVVGPADTPTGFSLLLASGRLVPFVTAPNATFSGKSAEAAVEGLQRGDYAIVQARNVSVVVAHRLRKHWVAYHVDFDVQPITPTPAPKPAAATITGTVTRVTVDGRRFAVQDQATLKVWTITIDARTVFRVDGQLMPGPPVLSKGDSVVVRARKAGSVWVATEVNLRTTASQSLVVSL